MPEGKLKPPRGHPIALAAEGKRDFAALWSAGSRQIAIGGRQGAVQLDAIMRPDLAKERTFLRTLPFAVSHRGYLAFGHKAVPKAGRMTAAKLP